MQNLNTDNGSKSHDHTLWYFAFGSNMNDITLNRRRVKPIERKRGKLQNWKLTYNLRGVPFFEPSFANIEPVEGSVVHGVCHRITPQEWEGIKATEGGGGLVEEGYQTIELEIETYEGDMLKAVTLTVLSPKVKHLKRKQYPSKRYISLLIGGAEAHGLDEAYVAWLKRHREYDASEHVKPSWLRYICYASVLSTAPIVIPLFAIPHYVRSSRLPDVVSRSIAIPFLKLNFLMSSILWTWHDVLHWVTSPLGWMYCEKQDGEISLIDPNDLHLKSE